MMAPPRRLTLKKRQSRAHVLHRVLVVPLMLCMSLVHVSPLHKAHNNFLHKTSIHTLQQLQQHEVVSLPLLPSRFLHYRLRYQAPGQVSERKSSQQDAGCYQGYSSHVRTTITIY